MPRTPTPSHPPSSENTNPFLTLRNILNELFWLAGDARISAKEDFKQIARTTHPWDDAEAHARTMGEQWGIPFTVFDPTLSQAKRKMRELVQVAAGNSHASFSSLDMDHSMLLERLLEFSYAVRRGGGAVTTPLRTRKSRSKSSGAIKANTAALRRRVVQLHKKNFPHLITAKLAAWDELIVQLLNELRNGGRHIAITPEYVKSCLVGETAKAKRKAKKQTKRHRVGRG